MSHNQDETDVKFLVSLDWQKTEGLRNCCFIERVLCIVGVRRVFYKMDGAL